MTYRSKVDWWIGLVLAGTVLVPLVLAYTKAGGGGGSSFGRPPIVSVVSAIVIFALIYPTRYTITSMELKIRSGLMRWRIPLSSIMQVYPTYDPRSSPALSLDRLRIDRVGGRSILISPKEQDAFLQELELRANLRRIGSRLVREDIKLFSQSAL